MKQTNGRMTGALDAKALRFSTSLPIDCKLYREDIEGSIAHATMLGKQKIIRSTDAQKIVRGLKAILKEIESGEIDPASSKSSDGRWSAEDIHMAIEARLIEKIGPVGGLLHTARSRNDQVALDVRLYLRKAMDEAEADIGGLQRALVFTARRYQDIIMPGYTHLQRAQPILLAHLLLAYVEMLERDRERFADCRKRVNRSPLGAAALAGTPFAIDRKAVASQLGMTGLVENSIDAVSDRDVHIEYLAACAITMMHLSRMAEDLILWHSQEWRFIELDDAYTTGSSIMPQKKNPDMAELVRGKTGRVYGALVSLLTVMKGLPMAYNRDMQEDKEPLLDAADTLGQSLQIMTAMYRSATFDANRFEEEWGSDFLLATEWADYLVRKGMPFRRAHGIVSSIVRYCLSAKKGLKDLPLPALQQYSKLFERDVYKLLNPRSSVKLKRSVGSTSPVEAQKSLRKWERTLKASSKR